MRTDGNATGGENFEGSTGRYQKHLLHPNEEGSSDNPGLRRALIWKTFHTSSTRSFAGQKAQMVTVVEPQAITLHRHLKDAETKVFVNVLEHPA
jgi:hypothetical protein